MGHYRGLGAWIGALFLPLALFLSAPAFANGQQCGNQNGGALCADSLCCSQYGWCGSTAPFCSPQQKCQIQCWASPPPATPAKELKRVAYFANWAHYNPPPYSFVPEDLKAGYLTHLLYAFASIDTKTRSLVPSDYDTDITNNFYVRFNKAAHAIGAKTLLSVGGGDAAATAAFNTVASTAESRTRFIANAIAYARKYGFDGLDLDWELPNTPTNKANFASLIKSFRAAILAEATRTRRASLLLTAAVAAYVPDVKASYDVPSVDKYLDWVNVMTYDLHGSWDVVTGEHTALADLADPSLSIHGAVTAWLSLGLSPKKLVLGLATYGHSWTLASASSHKVGARARGVGYGGPITKDTTDGSWAYFEIVDFFLRKDGATAAVDSATSSAYAYKGTQWIGYDNPKTISIKASYARQQGLGGYMFWTVDEDKNYELIGAAKAVTS